MPQIALSDTAEIVTTLAGGSEIVLVCEHASAHIPPELNDLGLAAADRLSHAVWDPGALAVAQHMAQLLDATLVASGISRLVYDCNRPPHAPDAMPEQSELIRVSGNLGLDAAARKARTDSYYTPFKAALAAAIAGRSDPIIITVHSFTPTYHGKPRAVEIGILHDTDTRLADAMLANAALFSPLDIQRNAPYGPEDGVTHTLKEHAIAGGHPNIMLELRNDLIADDTAQHAMARMLSDWIAAALNNFERTTP